MDVLVARVVRIERLQQEVAEALHHAEHVVEIVDHRARQLAHRVGLQQRGHLALEIEALGEIDVLHHRALRAQHAHRRDEPIDADLAATLVDHRQPLRRRAFCYGQRGRGGEVGVTPVGAGEDDRARSPAEPERRGAFALEHDLPGGVDHHRGRRRAASQRRERRAVPRGPPRREQRDADTIRIVHVAHGVGAALEQRRDVGQRGVIGDHDHRREIALHEQRPHRRREPLAIAGVEQQPQGALERVGLGSHRVQGGAQHQGYVRELLRQRRTNSGERGALAPYPQDP